MIFIFVFQEWKKTWLFVDKKVVYYINEVSKQLPQTRGGGFGRDHMVVGFITTYAISAYQN